ncbi:MAG: zinc-ribbon domain containing protein [Dehalococcoidia bacterium]|nr:zinc-ribbon domain containing protein [Dehalococcoidia bacterium]
MSYADKTLTCSDCSASFTFSASEQEFFASKNFTHDPARCPDCRSARKQQRGGNGYGNGSGGYRQQREMHPAVCASCGTNTQVPFEPREGRPVYCSDCYSKTRR